MSRNRFDPRGDIQHETSRIS